MTCPFSSQILFWRFFTFGIKRKEESEWLVRIDATLRVGVVEWRKWQFFGICGLFLAQVNVMICGTESKSELGFLNGNSFGICDWVWVGVNVAICSNELGLLICNLELLFVSLSRSFHMWNEIPFRLAFVWDILRAHWSAWKTNGMMKCG